VRHPDAKALERERLALDWALRAGATAAGLQNDNPASNLSMVPKDPFVVNSLSLPPSTGAWAHGASALAGLSHISKLGGQDLIGADDLAEHLARLPSLNLIDLSGSDLTDDGLERLTALEGLEHLYLRRCAALSGDGLRHLAAFPHLWYLHLDSGGFIDADIEHVGKVDGLQALGLDFCQGLTSDALRHLRPLSILRALGLVGTAIDDADVEHLSAMPGLRNLNLQRTKVTAAGIDRLRQALPDCAILWDGGVVVPGEPSPPANATATPTDSAP
jgi:hypothetical protein